MTTADPISLAQAQRLAANADTILLRATRPADLETPIGAFLRLDDGGPAYLLELVEGGERLGRYSFLGVGPRRLLEVRDGLARIQTRPGDRADLFARPADRDRRRDRPARRHPGLRPAPSRPADRRDAALHRRRRRCAGVRRDRRLRDDRAAPRARPGRRSDRRVHRDRPRPRLRPPDPHAVGDRLAAHRRAGPRGPLPDRRGGDLRGPGAERAPERGRDRRVRRRRLGERRVRRQRVARRTAGRRGGRASLGGPVGTSLGREEYIHAVEVAKDAIAAGEAIQVVLARRQSFDLPDDPATGTTLDGIGLYRSLRRVNPSPYLFFVRTPGFEVVGASPELLLQVEGDKLTTHPIAGTRPRGANDREDALLSEELQRDPKERAEHVMLVDLGRNDLGRVARAGTVTVSKYMEVERYSHVLHLVSHVEGAAQARARRARRAALGLPGRDAVGGAQGPRDAAHRGRRGRASRAVWRRGRLPRLRRQPRHRDHHPECGPQGRPGPRPHRRRDRRRVGPGTRVRGDRAQGGGPAPGDRDGGGRHARAPAAGAAAELEADEIEVGP